MECSLFFRVAPNSVVTRPAPKAKASQNPQALRRTASFDVSRPPASAPVRSNLTGESTQEYAQSRRQVGVGIVTKDISKYSIYDWRFIMF